MKEKRGDKLIGEVQSFEWMSAKLMEPHCSARERDVRPGRTEVVFEPSTDMLIAEYVDLHRYQYHTNGSELP